MVYRPDLLDSVVAALSDARAACDAPHPYYNDAVKDYILRHTYGLEVLYPDADFMAGLIDRWASTERAIWARLIKTTVLEYDPIENYNRMEEWSDNTIGAETETGEETEAGNASGSTSGESSSESEVKQSNVAFNSNDFKDATRNTENGSSTNETSESSEYSNSRSRENSTTHSNNVAHTGRVHGNIGVTTTQQMIEAERNISQFCIEDYIAQQFRNTFCIQVY